MSRRIDFAAINRAAIGSLPALLRQWLPDGRRVGHDYIARNPRRLDRHAGSFRIDARSGKWIDHATGDRGRDIISLLAFLRGQRQSEAALQLAQMLGLDK
jgi:hypothetical protein